METKWKDVIGMYFDCEVIIEKSSQWAVSQLDIHKGETRLLTPTLITEIRAGKVTAKPLLRKLSDMTEAEESEYWKLRGTGWTSNTEQQMLREATGTKYLLSKHFDLFSLIPNGQAIDRTTLPSLTNQ